MSSWPQKGLTKKFQDFLAKTGLGKWKVNKLRLAAGMRASASATMTCGGLPEFFRDREAAPHQTAEPPVTRSQLSPTLRLTFLAVASATSRRDVVALGWSG